MNKMFAIIGLCFLTLFSGQVAIANATNLAKVETSATSNHPFSLERAQAHLNIIAQQPHIMGSKAHKQVQNYLFKELSQFASQLEIQRGQVARQGRKPTTLGYVENIIAKIPGTAPQGKALLLMSHYDSQAHTFGAGDAGHGVAAILETLTVLKNAAPLKNDLIILLSDGEEIGLLGAQLFFNEHTWAKEVGMALNFEARGNAGPVFMFETSNNNRRMVEEFINAVPRPSADSLFASVYRVMPNSTDFTVLSKQGISGLNFAPIGNLVAYHSMLDTAQNISPETFLQTGEQMLSLTQHFGNIPLPLVAQENLTYFTLPGHHVISYGVSSSLIIGGCTLLLLSLCFFFYLKNVKGSAIRKPLIALSATMAFAVSLFVTMSALHHGILSLAKFSAYEFYAQASLIGLIVFCAFIVLFSKAVKLISNALQWPWVMAWTLLVTLSAVYLGWSWLVIAIIALVIFLVLALIKRMQIDLLNTEDFQFSGLFLWALILILGMWKMPDAVHVLYWPLLVIACVELIFVFKINLSHTFKNIVRWMAVIAVLFWWSFYITQLHSALGIDSIGVLSVIIFLLIITLPVLNSFLTEKYHRLITTTCLLAAGLLIGYTFGPANALPLRTYDTFLYINAQERVSQWGSKQSGFPEWSQLQEEKTEKENQQWNKIDPNSTAAAMFTKKQSVVSEGAVFEVVTNTQDSKTHRSHIKIHSPMGAELLDIYIQDAASITSLIINDQVIEVGKTSSPWLNIKYYGNNPNGVDIKIEKNNAQAWKLRVNEISFHQHPQIKMLMQARPEHDIPNPYSLSDAVIISSELTVMEPVQ
jgi:hypothetical protein